MSNTNLVRPSRDGDQFHYLWAARRCLRLLAPHSELVAISIEGSSPDERASATTALPGEDLIDIAEYFGSEDVGQATAIHYMQLKHSTLQTTAHFTASGLEKTISGFAKRYKELLALLPSGELDKVQFWFVTNRTISTDVTEAVEDAANGVAARHQGEHAKLERFTGLKGTSLSAFCQRLRFEASQDDYWTQRNILLKDLSGYLPDADIDAPTQLKELVTRKALSESESNPVVTKTDVLRALGTDEGRLFPAECLNEGIPSAIPRVQEAALVQSIIDAGNRPVIVHALAGVGKSVFATRVRQSLPTGSHAVLYDCFGNGQYRSATAYRHRHQDGLVQIANELAASGLCHPLIPPRHANTSTYLRAFLHRLRQAVTVLRHGDPQALLCIIIDAADNAQLAAHELGESRSFPRDLLREKLPDGVRLVVTCRTHRQDDLDPPFTAVRLELQAFSREETASHLRSAHPAATDRDVEEFHRLSSQNPRVQALALSRKLSLPETLRKLGPNPRTVESAIGTLLSDAIAKLADSVGPVERDSVKRICVGLATLRPLIPISVLSSISGVPEDAIRAFALDLGRPLHLAGDTIQFYDEPAETWFREQFRPSTNAMADFVRHLRPLSVTSAYVASTLPQLMLEAGQLDELVELALTSAALPDTNQLVKRDIELQRLHFALKASLRTRRLLDATKLALKAGDERAGDVRQRMTIQENTDLAAIFLDAGVMQDLVSRRSFASGWTGSHHVYEAGLLSGRAELLGDARSRLRMANEWLRNWSRLAEAERKKEPVSNADIAELALVDLNIHGAKAAAYSLRGWTPREVSFRVGRMVARRLIDHGRFVSLDELAVAAGNNLCLVLAIVVELRSIQRTPPAHVVRRAFRLVSHSLVSLKPEAWDMDESALDAVTALVEATLACALCQRAEASAVLARYLPATPPRGLSSHHSPSRAPLLRAYCLKAALDGSALQLADLAHPELRAELDGRKSSHSSSQEVREFEDEVKALLPWYQLWASALLGDIPKETFADALSRTRETSSRSPAVYYRDRVQASNEIVLVWFDLLHRLNVLDEASLGAMTRWIADLKRPLFTPTLTSMMRLGSTKDATKALALKLAGDAFALIKDERADAESKSSDYIGIARAVLTISTSDATAYFNEALDVSGGIGEENLARWGALLDLADHAARPTHSAPEAAYQLARCAELTYAYVVRDKHFDWSATVEALAGLCPCSALAILSRWRDRGFGQSGRLLHIAVEALIDRGAVDARDALPLLGFDARWDYIVVARHVLSRCVDRSEKETAAAFLYRYMNWEPRPAATWRALKAEVTTNHAVPLADLDATIAFAESEERAAAAEKAGLEQVQEQSVKHEEQAPDWDAVFAGVDLTTAAGVSKGYLAFKRAPHHSASGHFFSHAFGRLPIGSEPAFIAAVGEVPDFDLYDLRILLERLPEAWKGRPAVTSGLKSTLKTLCRRYCMEISPNRYYEVLPFKMACSLSGITEADLIDVVLDAIAESPDFAESSRLFSFVGLLTRKLTHEQALEGLTFGMSLMSASLSDQDGDGPWGMALAPPTTVQASIAGYIWAGLAAPAARLRWEAAHALVGLCALARQEVLGHIVTFASGKSGGPFVDSRLPFYDLHGLQWLLIAFARAAEEFPTPLAPFAARFVDWALRDQPHVMIRRFAAHTASILLARGFLAHQGDLGERLARVNETALPVLTSKSYSRVTTTNEGMAEGDDDDRFLFGIDIGPYWYRPLGEVFALSERDVESEAISVIRKDFGYAAKGRWDDDERARRKILDGEHSYHSHGSYPRVDDLRFYLAYHAMMVVAGRLLATKQVHHDAERGGGHDFAEWLSGHDLSRRDGRWLSDRRDPTPRERPAWRDRKRDDSSYAAVTIADFDEALRTGEQLNVWGHWTSADSQRVQSVRVQSALVSPERSLALLRALSTARNVHDYCIPSADSDLQISEPGFVLRGWITDPNPDRGLDGKDPWSGGVSYPPPMPASFMVELLGLQVDSDNRCWRDATGRTVMCSSVWGHLEERDEVENPERGERLQAPLTFFKDLLKQLGQDLIVGVEIERRRRDRRSWSQENDERERVPATARLYLVRADGSISTL